MADSRAYQLAKKTITALSHLTGVCFWTDKSGDSAAQHIVLAELLKTTAVEEASTVDYQMVTPKAFAATVATTDRKGIVELATQEEIASKASNKVIQSSDQTAMQTQWISDWFRKEGEPNIYYYAGYAMAWQMVDFINTMSIGSTAPLSPMLESARTFDSALVTLLVSSNLGEAYGIYKIPAGAGIKTTVPVMIGGVLRFYLTIDSTRKYINIESAASNSFIRVSATIQATLL
ncbi:MAG: hypothetical protein IPO21_14400 [Bacteroidales bacterium]|nr:hypothetical protein [Bacteroidales bacterium]